MIPLSERAEALRSLAAAVRSGCDVRTAILEWHSAVPSSACPDLLRIARRVRLGASPRSAVLRCEGFGEDAPAVASMVDLCRTWGADLPRMLDRLAASIELRASEAEAARAAGAGATLSARMIALLPAALVLLSPAAGAPLFDALGIALIAIGAVLAVAGVKWMDRLVPRPDPADDPMAICAEATAALLEAGVPLDAALAAVARDPPASLAAALRDASRWVVLGMPWPDALERSGLGLVGFARVVGRARRLGTPPVDELHELVAERRGRRKGEFEKKLRRAPVLMVIPLVLCVLPSFGFLALAPFLRGLVIGG